jgi:hypothetical protein
MNKLGYFLTAAGRRGCAVGECRIRHLRTLAITVATALLTGFADSQVASAPQYDAYYVAPGFIAGKPPVYLNMAAAPFSADPTGSVDSSAALNAAIAAAQATGCKVDIVAPGGNYLINNITLGNGSGDVPSTVCAPRIYGTGAPAVGRIPWGNFYPVVTPTKFTYDGPAGGRIFTIQGPITGWGISNVLLQCNDTASVGIYVSSGQFGNSEDIAIDMCRAWAIYSTT